MHQITFQMPVSEFITASTKSEQEYRNYLSQLASQQKVKDTWDMSTSKTDIEGLGHGHLTQSHFITHTTESVIQTLPSPIQNVKRSYHRSTSILYRNLLEIVIWSIPVKRKFRFTRDINNYFIRGIEGNDNCPPSPTTPSSQNNTDLNPLWNLRTVNDFYSPHLKHKEQGRLSERGTRISNSEREREMIDTFTSGSHDGRRRKQTGFGPRYERLASSRSVENKDWNPKDRRKTLELSIYSRAGSETGKIM